MADVSLRPGPTTCRRSRPHVDRFYELSRFFSLATEAGWDYTRQSDLPGGSLFKLTVAPQITPALGLCVDLFNEGVDVPDTVVFPRPTESAPSSGTIFRTARTR